MALTGIVGNIMSARRAQEIGIEQVNVTSMDIVIQQKCRTVGKSSGPTGMLQEQAGKQAGGKLARPVSLSKLDEPST